MNLYTTLKKLCLVSSVSGREAKIREEIKNIIAPFVDSIETDALGNLIALKVGIKTMLERCPRFAAWVKDLVQKCR